MAGEVVRTELREGVAVVRLDDGKANALSPSVIEALHDALDRAEKEAGAALLVGRPARLSGGFDLSVMRQGGEATYGLVKAGAELFARMMEFPRPVVVACTGHAIAAGALVLLAADTRFGARGEFKIGLNEVSIGMTLPAFATEMARLRLSKRHFLQAVSQSRMYAPDEAVDAGFLDRVVDPEALESEALAEAARLTGLSRDAFAHTKRRAQGPTVATIREELEDDLGPLKEI